MKNLFPPSLSRKKLVIFIASFLVFTVTLGFSFYEGTKKTVALTLNGQDKVVQTHAQTVEEVLKELGLTINSNDYLFPSVKTKVKDNLEIVWKQAKQVDIVKDNEKKTVWTTADTVAELLKEQKISLIEQDDISAKPEDPISDKMSIEINKALYLTFIDGSKKAQKVWSTSATVADFLTQQGITLKKLDRVQPSLQEKVEQNAVIKVIRVEKVTDVVEEPINFAVVTKKDTNLAKGKEKIVKEGKQGLKTKKFEVVLENGKEVSRKLVSEKTVREKEDKVVALGTRVLVAQVSRGSMPSGGKEFYVSSTAYTAGCNGCSGITATGINLRANPNVKVIAVDPRIIPLGTKVYVEGYGYAIAADKGSAIKGYKIDVFFPNLSDAYRWGNRKVKIKILN
ncbi:G5 and 3D domain-containing protein [Bacillus sp. EB01]|uniref:G5 and 3D domain-containing protein n=1 Tax=Bacillus sp. EB01 TaxID=1347086 RepID=UPI0005C799CF|nr:G5 and 3D domain-containing protein [Bacillus sp. EB01]